MMWGYGGGAVGWPSPILMLFSWMLVIGGIVALWRFFSRHESHADRAQEMLSERYARGEISRAEFDLQHGLSAK